MTENLYMEFFKLFIQVLFICLGWGVVHHFSRLRDLDKMKREQFIKEAESLIDSVSNILELAREYHLVKSRDLKKESELKVKLQDLSHRISLLNKTSSGSHLISCASKSFVSFRKGISGQNFEDEHLSALTEFSDQLQAIASDAMDLKHMILRFKHMQLVD